ncbi:MAG: cbb3-type cytochrome oxidase assembly protein [Saprospiraceae bacterium]|nr:cbb3-type cytochrome oxidase assembly protein [Saprospiraceae bacterium]
MTFNCNYHFTLCKFSDQSRIFILLFWSVKDGQYDDSVSRNQISIRYKKY